jgi:hypothetical protein
MSASDQSIIIGGKKKLKIVILTDFFFVVYWKQHGIIAVAAHRFDKNKAMIYKFVWSKYFLVNGANSVYYICTSCTSKIAS